jgi:lysyl-tRNA synthetase class 2
MNKDNINEILKLFTGYIPDLERLKKDVEEAENNKRNPAECIYKSLKDNKNQIPADISSKIYIALNENNKKPKKALILSNLVDSIETPLNVFDERLKKIDELTALGISPYASGFEPDTLALDIHNKYENTLDEELAAIPDIFSMAGRIVGMRNFGKATFVHIADSSGKIQAYFSKDVLTDQYTLLKKLDVGDIIGLSGRLFRTKTAELTIGVNNFRILTKSLRPLPEKWHGLKDIEIRYRQRYVDLIINPEVKRLFEVRSIAIKAVRNFLEERRFIEVETPMLHSIAGGAAARPFSTHHNALDIDLFLRIAPELYLKKLLVGGFERVFELNKNFRNEGISTKHNPEFTMLEFYMAYKDYNFLMGFTEELFCYVAQKINGALKITYGETLIDLTPPWKKITFIDALKENNVPENILTNKESALTWARANKIDVKTGSSFGKILDEIFSEMVEPKLIQPTFIIDYPVELSPLAKRSETNPDFVERFELFIAAREIANAFSELNDPIDQRHRFEHQVEARDSGDDEAHRMDEDFLRALEYGMPPAAGEGIGIDRMIMLLTNSLSIRDVILFPQLRPEQ